MTYPDVQKFLDQHVLEIMHDGTTSFGPYETGWNLSCFVNDWITKDMARAICRSLTDRGYCHYMRALWSDDGMPAGAGYGITPKGVAYLKSLIDEVRP